MYKLDFKKSEEPEIKLPTSVGSSKKQESSKKTSTSALDFPGGSDSKVSAYNAGNPGSIPGSGRSPGEGNGNLLQCSCLENPRDGGAWSAAIYGVAQSRAQLEAT